MTRPVSILNPLQALQRNPGQATTRPGCPTQNWRRARRCGCILSTVHHPDNGPSVTVISLGPRARQGCFVAVLGEVTDDAAFLFRRTGVDGFLRRVVMAFPEQDRFCVVLLGARMVLQQAGEWLPGGVEGDGARRPGQSPDPWVSSSLMIPETAQF